MRQRGTIIILFLLLSQTVILAQTPRIDSLLKIINTEKNPHKQFPAIIDVSRELLKFDLMRAMAYAQEAVEIANDGDNNEMRGKAFTNLGNTYLYYGRYDKALNYLMMALDVAENIKDTVRIGKVCNNIGAVYYRMANYEQALKYFNLALNYLKLVALTENNNELYANLYSNIGNIYLDKNDFDSAAIFYKKGIEAVKNTKFQEILSICYTNLSIVYIKTNQPDSSYYCLINAVAIRKRNSDKRGLSSTYHALADYFKHIRQIDSAIHYTVTAYKYANELDDLLFISKTAASLSDLYEEIHQNDSALKYLRISAAYDDSVYNENTRNEFNKIELRYRLEKQEAELKAAQIKKELLYIIIVITLCALIFLVTLLFFVVRNRQKRVYLEKKNLELERNNLVLENENLQQDLIIRNKELTTNVLNLVQKNEIIKNITDKLLAAKNTMLPENKDVVNRVVTELQQSTDEGMWQEFELRFQQVHSAFYEKLNKQFPDLTPNETKLCAFLRLNMTTKEIEAITKQSQRSIEVARSRLRKKLNITNTDANLVTFLAQL